jgi:mRNA interferase RelE/StbE
LGINLPYLINYHKAVKGDLKIMEALIKARIKSAIETRLVVDPIKSGETLRGNFKRFRKLRIGDYRIIYKVMQGTVLILGIGHRKYIYELVKNREH